LIEMETMTQLRSFAGAEVVTPMPNRPFSIHQPGQVWIVESGKLDLFLVDVDGDDVTGPREHVLRVEPGDAVFGFVSRQPNVALVACAAPDTRLLSVTTEQVLGTPEAHSLVDDWLAKLGTAATLAVPAPESIQLEPGQSLSVDADPKNLIPKDGVLWLKSTGELRFTDDADLPVLPAGEYVPASRFGWLQAAPKTKIVAITTPELVATNSAGTELQRYHGLILDRVVLNRARGEAKERERLATRADADSALVDAAIRTLATPLSEDGTANVVADDLFSTPLLAACQAVGNAMGIRIKANSAIIAGKVRNPVQAIARVSGIRIRRVVLKDNWWKSSSGPMLAYRDADNSPCALIPTSGAGYEIYDPVTKQRRAVNKQIASTLNGFGLVFYRPFPAKALTAKELIAFGLHGCKGDLTTILLMGLASGLLGMVTPIATGIIFDSVIPGAQRGQLFQLSMFLVISAISTALFTLTRSIALLRLEGKMDATIQAAVWDRLLALPVPFFREYTSGDLATRGMGINQIRQTLTGSTLSSILSGFFSIFSFALLFYYSWRLALLATALIAVAFIVSTVCGYMQVSQQRSMSKIRGRISGMVLQFINGISKFRVAGTEGRAFAAWAREFTKQKDMAMKARGVTNGLTVFNAAFPVLSTAGIYYYTAYLMTQPTVTPLTTGDFLAFNSAFGQFLQAALQLSSSFVSVLGIVPLYERAQPIFQTLPEVDEAKGDPGVLRGNIEVNHLAFRYREDTPLVLRDLSLSIAAGEFVAFVGASGCGKSTLFRLLLGFEKPESGAIYYDGQDMAGLDIQAVRQQMGVVLQNGKLLSGDIFTNIVGSAPLTVEDAWEAARLSGLDQDISAMPMGMHTVVSEGGGGLSGGQRQRLMIARAIVGKPRILLFDEATSALDNQTQATVGRSLEALQATRIVIAHRLSTIINADRIFVLDKGVVVQSGTYAELIEQEGLFADLAKRQLT